MVRNVEIVKVLRNVCDLDAFDFVIRILDGISSSLSLSHLSLSLSLCLQSFTEGSHYNTIATKEFGRHRNVDLERLQCCLFSQVLRKPDEHTLKISINGY